MKAFIGTKIVQAEPMSLYEFLQRQGKEIPAGEIDKPGYLVVYADSYQSWSPADVFEQCYRPVDYNERNLVASGDI